MPGDRVRCWDYCANFMAQFSFHHQLYTQFYRIELEGLQNSQGRLSTELHAKDAIVHELGILEDQLESVMSKLKLKI